MSGFFDDFGLDDILQLGAGLAGAWAGSQDQTVTTENLPYLYPGQEQGIADVIDLARQEYLAGPRQYFPARTVAELDPNTVAGQNLALGSTGIQQQLANLGTFSAGELASGGAGRVEGFQLPDQIGYGIDQGLQNAVMNPVMRELENRILPGIELQATSQGAFGGTRQAMMQGQAAANATEQAAEALARANMDARAQNIQQRETDIRSMLEGRSQDINQNQLYNQALQSATRAVPAMMGAQLVPSQTMIDVGKQRQAYEQSLINADMNRWDFEQMAPQDALTLLGQRMTMNFPSGSTGTTINPANAATILGGALTGTQLLNQFLGSNQNQTNNTYTDPTQGTGYF